MLGGTTVHLLAGGFGGTLGAVLTCPLEVVKVRLQSSHKHITEAAPVKRAPHISQSSFPTCVTAAVEGDKCPGVVTTFYKRTGLPSPTSAGATPGRFHWRAISSESINHSKATPRVTIIGCLRDIARTEGVRALFKGLVPTLVGVFPSRAIYFSVYHNGQLFFKPIFPEDSPATFMCAAALGSFAASTATNPIWYVKTRLQLDHNSGKRFLTVGQIVKDTYRQYGLRGFYKGVTASYVGSTETALHFVVYEFIKSRLLEWEHSRVAAANNVSPAAPSGAQFLEEDDEGGDQFELEEEEGWTPPTNKMQNTSDMVFCMMASACSKGVAITIAYPHEVVRTRLREAGDKYRGFVQTIRTVVAEEGAGGLYRGLATHYVRQIPNACIMIGTYECVVFLLHKWGLTECDL